MVPKIIFHRSWIYDVTLEPLRDKGFKMLSDRVMHTRIKNIEKEWRKYGEKMLKEISKVTRLKWHQKNTTCYITAGIIPFSDPLTMNARKDPRRAIHTLTHEMIHRLISEKENHKRISKNWQAIMRTYKKESSITSGHVVINAIHEHILRKFFGDKELDREKEEDRISQAHYRAWKIGEKEGYKKIIARLNKGL